MQPGFALTGWLAASIAVVVAIAALRWHAATLESVARVSHELRGPLTAVRLGLHLGTRGAELTEARIRALDLELSRAAVALDDLTAVRRLPALVGPGASALPGAGAGALVDLGALLSDCAEAAQAGRGDGSGGTEADRRGGARGRARRSHPLGAGDREPDRQRDRTRGRGDRAPLPQPTGLPPASRLSTAAPGCPPR